MVIELSPPIRARVSWLPLATTLGALLLMLVVTVWLMRVDQPDQNRTTVLGATLVLWGLFAIAATAVLRVPGRRAIVVVLLGGFALSLAALLAPPQTTTDHYRYVWDGRVQLSGIDPYRYAPTDPALAPLRDEWLWPPGRTCPELGVTGPCPVLNHPTVPTIYPPVAEAWFTAVQAVSPDEARATAVQVGALVLASATTVALLVVLAGSGGDPRRAALWAWCPVVVLDAVNNAHIDVLAALLLVIALGVAARGRVLGGGILLGLAAAVKPFALVAVPSLIRRRPWALCAGVVAAVAVVYLPHVLAVGDGVTGFLGGYLDEEGTQGMALLRLALPDALVLPCAALVLAVAVAVTVLRSDPEKPWESAGPLTAVVLLVLTPAYSWYALGLVALVALGARVRWLAVAVAMAPVYLLGASTSDTEALRSWCYGGAVVVLLSWAAIARLAPSRRRMTSP